MKKIRNLIIILLTAVALAGGIVAVGRASHEHVHADDGLPTGNAPQSDDSGRTITSPRGQGENYAVTVKVFENGTASVSESSAAAGTKVTVSATPDEGYELDRITWKPEGGAEIDITEDAKFIMPAANVTVYVSFRAKPPVILTTTLPPVYFWEPYNYTIEVNDNAIKPVSILHLEGSPPDGLTLDEQTGLISGVPTVTDDNRIYTLKIRAKDANGRYSDIQTLLFFVNWHYAVTVAADPLEGGTVTGGGTVKPGQSVTVEAKSGQGYLFEGWYFGQDRVSEQESYSFVPEVARPNIALIARFSSCGHDWQEATCTEPKTCARCHMTEGNPLGHDWKEATCTEPKTCKNCGETEGIALGHDWGEWTVTIPATEDEEGEETRICKNDNNHKETKNIAKLNHVHVHGDTVVENEKPAACETEGSYDEVVYCSKCKEELSRHKEEISALGHDWDEWTVTRAATEDADGEEKRICKNDAKHIETRGIPSLTHVHDLEKVDEKKASCTASGEKEHYKCKKCGHLFEDSKGALDITEESLIIPPLGHTEGEVTKRVVKKATCEANGEFYEEVHCNVCGVLLTEELFTEHKLGHDWSIWSVIKPADCVEKGEEERVCNNDNAHKETRVLDATGHDWGEWKEIKAATENAEGQEERICKNNAEHKETRSIPVLGHVHGLSKVAAKEAGCHTEGNIEYWICNTGDNPCGRYFADEAGKTEINVEDTVVKAKGHEKGNVVKEKEIEATCDTEGSFEAVVYCKHCAEELSREVINVPATGHNWDEGVVTTQPTCNGHGIKTFTCKNDPLHTYTEEIPASGHDWGEWIVTKEPTETEEGEETRVCKYDKTHVESRTIPVLEPVVDDINYANTAGDGNTWTKGSGEISTFTFKRSENDEETFDRFIGILVDGKEVSETNADGSLNYEKETGSVNIKLQPDYLETLAVGNHTITAQFNDGSASANFIILAAEEKKEEEPDNIEPGEDIKGDPTKKTETTVKRVASGGKKTKATGTIQSASTGDENGAGLWMLLTCICAAAIPAAVIYSIRKNAAEGRCKKQGDS